MSAKISALTAASALTGTEIVPVVQGGANRRTTAADIAALAEGGQGGTGPTGSGTAAVTLAELIALAIPANGECRIVTDTGRAGLFKYSTANLSTYVTADTQQGIYVAPASDTDGSSGAWVRHFDGAAQISWFLATSRTAFVTDDLAAFDCALATLKARRARTDLGSEKLNVGTALYYLSDTWNIHHTLHIEIEHGALIRFGNNCNGIVFNFGNTHGDGAGAQGNAGGSRLTLNGSLYGGNVNVDGSGAITSYGAGDSTTGHGIRIRCPAIEIDGNGLIAFFGDDGININATSGGAADVNGNANTFKIGAVTSIYNGRYGILINGADANAGTTSNMSLISNAGCGMVEYSFLGNTHIQPHTRDNGNTNPVATLRTGVCTYAGHQYYPLADQLTAASTTTPGTDATVWVLYDGLLNSRTWTTGLEWIIPGAYATNPANLNARNLFLGPYAENGHSPIQAKAPSLFVGGLITNIGFHSWSDNAVHIEAGSKGLAAYGFSASIPSSTKYTTLGGPDPAIALTHFDGTSIFDFLEKAAGRMVWRHAGTEVFEITSLGPRLSGGTGLYDSSGNFILTSRQTAVADATGAGDVVAQLNSLLAKLRNHGLIAT